MFFFVNSSFANINIAKLIKNEIPDTGQIMFNPNCFTRNEPRSPEITNAPALKLVIFAKNP